MRSFPASITPQRPLLLAVAAPVEIRAVLTALHSDIAPPALWDVVQVRPGLSLLHCGVSKANAAGSVARCLVQGNFGAVLNVGIAGALPAPAGGLTVGQVIAASACVFADEGLQTDQGFQDVAAMGFPLDDCQGCTFACEPALVEAFRPTVNAVAPIATVSICSGTDASARAIADRTGALAESMEGAAIALVCRRLTVPMCEVRAISNLTGRRAGQHWDIAGALTALGSVMRRVLIDQAR